MNEPGWIDPGRIRTLVLQTLRERGKSRYWLANHPRLGMSRNYCYRWLRGESNLSSQKLAPVLSILGIRLIARHGR